MRITAKLGAALLAATCVLGAASCTDGDGTPAPTQQAEPTAAQRLDAAKERLDATPSVHLALTSSDVPQGSTGVIAAEGVGAHPPAFDGTFTVALQGVQGKAEVTAVDGRVWAKLPIVPGKNEIDPEQFGIPDPAVLFSPDEGLTSLLTATQDPVLGDKVRKGTEVLTSVTGTLPGDAVVDLFLVGDRGATYAATYALTDEDELREVGLTGPFFGSGTTSTYRLVLDRYGEDVAITAPAAGS